MFSCVDFITKMANCVWLPIIHFNDVYNLPPNDGEPIGGAARFRTALIDACKPLQSPFYEELEPLVLFSGDALLLPTVHFACYLDLSFINLLIFTPSV